MPKVAQKRSKKVDNDGGKTLKISFFCWLFSIDMAVLFDRFLLYAMQVLNARVAHSRSWEFRAAKQNIFTVLKFLEIIYWSTRTLWSFHSPTHPNLRTESFGKPSRGLKPHEISNHILLGKKSHIFLKTKITHKLSWNASLKFHMNIRLEPCAHWHRMVAFCCILFPILGDGIAMMSTVGALWRQSVASL